jgi:hypothetical protein
MCPIPNGFRDRAISLYSSKTVDKKEILREFLIPVFIVQVTKLVQFTYYNIFSKIPPSTSMHFATRVRTWRVARLYSVQWNSSISKTVRNKTHVHIHLFCFEWPTLWPPKILTYPPGIYTYSLRDRWLIKRQAMKACMAEQYTSTNDYWLGKHGDK